MKNTIKISIMSGLVTAGVLLCGLPHAMAESVPQNNETYYSVNVPSEISLSPDQDETTFTVSGNTYQKRWLDIDITSKNNFNLKNGQVSIPYKLDKTKLEYEPQYIDKDSDSFSESIKVSKNEADVKYSGNYQDQLQFTMNPIETRTIQLDCNGGTVDGKSEVKYTVKNGSSYGQLPTPIKNGYNFIAWKDENGTSIYSGSIVKADTEKLYATFDIARTTSIRCITNGSEGQGFENVGLVDIYVNGRLYSKDTTGTMWQKLGYGGEMVLKNIRLEKGVKFLNEVTPTEGCHVITDENNNLIEVHVTANPKGVMYDLNFSKINELQELINKTSAQTVSFDDNIPSNITKIGELTSYKSKAYAYFKDNVLHIYNPDGGKVVAPENCTSLFSYISVDNLDLQNLDVSQMKDASYMFNHCSARNINVDSWNTKSLINCHSMFAYCDKIKSLNVSSWNTSSVNNFHDFLFSCTLLKSIDVSNFDTSNCEVLFRMFGCCSQLENIQGLENFNTSKCVDFAGMFQSINTKTLNLSSFDTSKAYAMNYMFGGNWNLTEIIGLDHFNTEGVVNMNDFFRDCHSLKTLDLSSFSTKNVTNINDLFTNSPQLQTIYVSDKFNITSIKSASIFNGCVSLVGGSGTKYDPAFIDTTAARIDGGINSPGYFTLAPQKAIGSGAVLNIEGSDYIVMNQTNDGNYLVISGTNIGNMQYQPNKDSNGNYITGKYEIPNEKRSDGQYSNTYEGSYIDNYLENAWFKQLPEKLQKAIQTTNIKQTSYKGETSNPKWKFFAPNGETREEWYYNEGTTDTPKWVIYSEAKVPDDALGAYSYNCWTRNDNGYNNVSYNTISRHVFLPSVEEVTSLVDLNNANRVFNFLRGTNNSLSHMWLRDSYTSSPLYASSLVYSIRSMNADTTTTTWVGVRPAFVIDLSKVNATVVDTVKYK